MSIVIYGKDGCPYTMKARAAHPDATYHDVSKDPAKLEEMLTFSDGVRKVPVIVTNGTPTIGYGGT